MTRDSTRHLSRAQAYKQSLETTASPATARVVVTLTKLQYKKLEDRFPMRPDTKDPINAAIQLGQQQVLQALRDGVVTD